MNVSAMALILLIASGGVTAQDTSSVRTDCAWWESFDEFGDVGIEPMLPKLSYIAGVYDGLVFGKSQIRDHFVFTSYEIMSAGLDTFCSDDRNRRVRLVPALQVVAMRIKGESEDAIQRETRRLRAEAGENTR